MISLEETREFSPWFVIRKHVGKGLSRSFQDVSCVASGWPRHCSFLDAARAKHAQQHWLLIDHPGEAHVEILIEPDNSVPERVEHIDRYHLAERQMYTRR